MIYIFIFAGIALVLEILQSGTRQGTGQEGYELPEINGTTGLPMMGILDTDGNPFGSSPTTLFDDD